MNKVHVCMQWRNNFERRKGKSNKCKKCRLDSISNIRKRDNESVPNEKKKTGLLSTGQEDSPHHCR